MNIIRFARYFVLIYLSLTSSLVLAEKPEYFRFLDQKKSLIQWSKVDPVEWMSFERWRNESTLKDKHPDWENVVRERNVTSLMGRVLDCVGDCRLYKSQDFTRLQFRSSLYEGDDITTGKDSYLWIFMLDGTMVRLSPDSSITLRELNIGKRETVIHARLNSGNILWLGRSEQTYLEENLRETDSLFLPLHFFEANASLNRKEVDEDDLFSFLLEEPVVLNQTKRLNHLITENNQWTQKRKTYAFLVMPNGSVYGHDVQAEFIVLLGGESFVKRRDSESMRFTSDEPLAPLTFFYRGFENKAEFKIDEGSWYRVEETGRKIEPYQEPSLYGIGEFITRRIPSILVARELMMKKYSSFVFENLSALELAEKHGQLKWGQLDIASDDLAQRVSFIKEHTRRAETMQLLTSSRFKEKILEEREEVLESMVYNERFFSKALVNFKIKREIEHQVNPEGENLNSTQKMLWKILNARKQRQAANF